MSAAAAKRTVLAAASLARRSLGVDTRFGRGRGIDRDRESPTPPKNLRVISATPSRVQIAWDPSVDDVEVAGYYVFGDKGKATLDKPEQLLKPEYAVTELGCGESTVITVVAFDASQNRSEKATTTVATAACFDTQPPTPPSGFKQVATSEDSVVLAWDASSDNVGVVEYGVYRNLQREATAAEPTTTLSGLSCGSTYDYAVDASDAAGNRSLRASVFVQTASCPSPPSSGDTTPPSAPTGLAASNTTQTGLTLNWNAATDNVSVTGYDVYRNGSKITSVGTTNAGQTGLSCGTSYTFAVVARDAAGNSSPSTQLTAATSACSASSSGDTTPPSAPTGLAASNTTQTGLTVNWNAATDNVGVTGYDVYRNGSKITSVGTTNAGQTGLSCGTSYTFAVVARDAAGNSSPSTQLTAATSACSASSSGDTTPPSAPTGLAASNTTQTGLTLNWNAATDNVGVTGYDVYRNGSKITSVGTTNAGQTGLSCGTSYTFAVVARDAAGNSSPSTQLTAATSACSATSVDTTPPSQPTNLGIVGSTGSSVALAWSASSDNVGVAGYRVYVNGSFGSSTTQQGITVAQLNCGTAYTFEVEAFDAEGNSSQRASVTGSTPACPDTQPPSAPANVGATTRTATSIALSWTASSDNVGVVGYGLYRGGSAAGTTSTTTWILSGLTCNTNYTLAVDAHDAAGNQSSKVVVMVSTTACPDTTPPSVPTGLAASSVTGSSLTLGWNASSDNVGVIRYDVYRNGGKTASVTSTTAAQSGLGCGTSYTFAVEAYDAAGNVSPRAQISASTAACPPLPPPLSPPPGQVLFSGLMEGPDVTPEWSFAHEFTADRVKTVGPENGITSREGSRMMRSEVRQNECASWSCSMNVASARRSRSSGGPEQISTTAARSSSRRRTRLRRRTAQT